MTINITMAVLLACAIFITFYDAPAPDDSDLRLDFKPVAKMNNAVPLLSRLKGMHKTSINDFPEIKDISVKSPPDTLDTSSETMAGANMLSEQYRDSEFFHPIMGKNREALALFWEASKKPVIQYGPFWTMSPDYDEELQPSALDIITMARIIEFSCGRMRRDGQVARALDESCQLLDFSCRLASAERANLVQLVSAMAVSTIAIRNIAECVTPADDGASCIETARKLGALEISDSAMIASVKGEYALADEILRTTELQKMIAKGGTINRYLYKPNQTRTLFINMYRDVIAGIINGDVSDAEECISEMGRRRKNNMLQRFKPNAAGEILYSICAVSFQSAYKRIIATRAKTRQVACAFAIRAYWLEHRQMPPTLEALVPNYIESVPEDPFTNKPMRYDPAKAFLYCAGPERIDDDGAYAFEKEADSFGRRPFTLLDWAGNASIGNPLQGVQE